MSRRLAEILLLLLGLLALFYTLVHIFSSIANIIGIECLRKTLGNLTSEVVKYRQPAVACVILFFCSLDNNTSKCIEKNLNITLSSDIDLNLTELSRYVPLLMSLSIACITLFFVLVVPILVKVRL